MKFFWVEPELLKFQISLLGIHQLKSIKTGRLNASINKREKPESVNTDKKPITMIAASRYDKIKRRPMLL